MDNLTADDVGGPAMDGVELLHRRLHKIQGVPETVLGLGDDARSAKTVFASFHALNDDDREPLGRDIAEQSKTAIRTCVEACERLITDLQNWTKRSENGSLKWRDETNEAVLEQRKIKAISTRLQTWKVAINFVTSVATLSSSSRHSYIITEEIRRRFSATHMEIANAINATDERLMACDSEIEELKFKIDNRDGGSTSSDAETLQQIEEDRNVLAASRELLQELLSKSQEEAAKVDVKKQGRLGTVMFGDRNSGLQAGLGNSGMYNRIYSGRVNNGVVGGLISGGAIHGGVNIGAR